MDLSHELDYLQWLFGNIKIHYCKSKKLSNLDIETDDFLNLVGKMKKALSFQLTLNYFTREPTRQIYIDGKNISIQANLIKNKVICYEGKKRKIYNFANTSSNFEYKAQHLAILSNKFKDKLCTFEEGKQIVCLINKIKSKTR